jgi:MSHA biogenesis protein MshL
MNNTLNIFLIACVVGALGGCTVASSFVTHDEVRDAISKDLKDVIKERDAPDKTPLVRQFKRVYVKHLTKEDVKRPFWYSENRPLSATKNIPLLRLLQNTFDSLPVNFQFQQGIDAYLLVSTPDLDLTYGEILDYISSLTGYSHSILGRSVAFKKFSTEIFPIRQLPGKESYAVGKKGIRSESSGDKIGDKKVSGDFIGGSEQEYSVHEGSIDVMADIKLGVDSILGCFEGAGSNNTVDLNQSGFEETAASNQDVEEGCKKGSSSKVMRSSSSILVRALPSQMDSVRKFITEKNEFLTRQISIQVSFINIEFTDENQMNVDFELAAQSISDKIKVAASTTASGGILGGLDPRGVISIESTSPSISGSKVFLEALAHQGAVSKKTFPRVIATQNHVGVVGNIDRVSYISGRESFTSNSVGSQASIIQSETETGFLLYALPNIGDTDAIIKISTSQSALLDIDTKGEGDQLVESPIINDKLFNTTIKVEFGKPILIAGLSDTLLQSAGSESGVLPTGVARSSKEKTVETILMIEAIRL